MVNGVGNHRHFWILLFLLTFLWSGCQTIHYKASQPVPLITMKKLQTGPENFHYFQDLDFYWFGFYPGSHTVDLTQIIQENGAESGLTNVRIREESTTMNFIWQLITLGIYAPRYIEIFGIIVEEGSSSDEDANSENR